jgi:hypothetical protein
MHHRAGGEEKTNGGTNKQKCMNKVDGTVFWKHPPEDRQMYGCVQKNLL